MSHNRLSGHITSLEMLEQLRSVDVNDNRFSGSISKGILALPHLNQPNVSFNQLGAIEVNKLSWEWVPLQILDAQGNRLQGHLPVKLVHFGSVEVINLAYGGLTGRIPMTYGQRLRRPWRTLFLDDNFLTGCLPLPPVQ